MSCCRSLITYRLITNRSGFLDNLRKLLVVIAFVHSFRFCFLMRISCSCMFPYLWLSSFLSSLFLLYHFQQSRGKKSVLEEGDRQRAISSFASRAIEAHKQCNINGTLNNNLPKSASNITFLSDENPLTTQNPLYIEGEIPSSTCSEFLQNRKDFLAPFSPRRLPLKSAPWESPLGGINRAWTLPTRLSSRHLSDALSSRVIMDPVQWEQERIRTENERDEMQHSKGDSNSPIFKKIIGTKLSVKEKARQFEQQALQEMKQVKFTKSARSPTHSGCTQDGDSTLELSSESFLPSPDRLSPSSPFLTPCSEVVELETPIIPSVIITHHDSFEQLSPPPDHKPTPPSFRVRIPAQQNLLTTQSQVEVLENIPDPPKTPPPLPPPLLPPPPPTPPPLPPQLPSPPTRSLSSSSSMVSINQSPSKHPKSPSKQDGGSPQACVPDPPPPRRELKGILKNIQNLADIEKSVANMYSQIDRNHMLPKHIAKLKPIATPEPPSTETAAEAEHSQQNGNLTCIVEELEKRFPSQSTALWQLYVTLKVHSITCVPVGPIAKRIDGPHPMVPSSPFGISPPSASSHALLQLVQSIWHCNI